MTFVANPPNARDMAFRSAGLENPTIEHCCRPLGNDPGCPRRRPRPGNLARGAGS
jgi:hypothetical protein